MPTDAIIENYLDREQAVIDEIAKYEEISQNKLLRIIVERRKRMAKRTFEKTLENIRLKGLADFKREKNKKLWYIQSKKLEELTELEEFIIKQEKKLPTSSKEFSKKTLTEKSNEIKFLFSIYEASLSFNTIMFSLGKTPKKEFDQYQSLMSRFLNVNMKIWKNDKDAKHLFSELILSLMKTSPFFSSFLQVVDEKRKIKW
jgi:hypothetical protein